MRKLIAGMQSSVDGRIEGREGYADWVETWSDNYDVMPHTDACLLGAGMYPGYEGYWSAVQNEPQKPLPMTDRLPTAAEIEWARFAAPRPREPDLRNRLMVVSRRTDRLRETLVLRR